jgi:WD40 repeat protein
MVLAWSPDSKLLAIGGFAVLVWEPASNQQLFSYRGHSGAVTALAWSPDGQMIASGGYDETVQVWKAS